MQDGVVPYPSIAQLAERETVEAQQLSLGHWFESGWSEVFLCIRIIERSFRSFYLTLKDISISY